MPKRTTTKVPNNTSQHKRDLARIRNNQRRSRARRKEYLGELEKKCRLYDQMGIEATTEMQQAARKVLDENKKLRILLNQKGVSDKEIDDTFTTSFHSLLPSDTLTKLLSTSRTVSSSPISQLQQSEETHTPLPMPHPLQQLLTPPMSMDNFSPSPGLVVSPASTPIKYETIPVIYASSRDLDEQFLSSHSFEYEPNMSSIDPSWTLDRNTNDATSLVGCLGCSYASCGDVADIPRDDAVVKLENVLGGKISATDFYVDNTNAFTSQAYTS